MLKSEKASDGSENKEHFALNIIAAAANQQIIFMVLIHEKFQLSSPLVTLFFYKKR